MSKRTSHGVTIKLAKWSGGDVGYECLLALASGVCVAAVFQWLL